MNTRTKAFFESENGVELRQQLVDMTQSDDYNTRTAYSTQDANGLSFVQKHMNYMSQYSNVNHFLYVSNLKLMTKRKKFFRALSVTSRGY